MIPHVRVPKDLVAPAPNVGYQDQDNFVRNLATVLLGWPLFYIGGLTTRTAPRPVSRTAGARAALITVSVIKMHLRIEEEQTDEDAYLAQLEMAARLHTENYLRRDLDATVGEHIKQAMLLLIAHWYRNRETVIVGATPITAPLAYESLLSPERDYTEAFGAGDAYPLPPPDVAVESPGIGYAEFAEGSLPLWPATYVFVDGSVDIPEGEWVLEIRLSLSVDAVNKDDIITVVCNDKQQAKNLGSAAGAVLSEVFTFDLLPPSGAAYPLKIEAGANRAGVAFHGIGGATPEWISYASWVIAKRAS